MEPIACCCLFGRAKGMESQDIDGLKKEYDNYRFKNLERIEDGICLSWDSGTGKLCRLRSISEEKKEVYRCLQTIEDSHLPDILYIGSDFVAEEYIDGCTLKERMEKGSLTHKEVREILKQLLPSVQQLHKNGIIHRDIKASNIMSEKYGKYYLVDFDIAIKRGTGSETAGTVGYASPEQYGYRDCDARSDIYSIGVLANMLLTGCTPRERVAKGSFGRIIKKCIMIDPEDRYQTVEELFSAVFYRKKHIVKRFLISMVCVLLVLAVFIWWRNSRNVEDVKSTGVINTGVTEEIDSVNLQWMELKDYNISYPCLQGMEQAGKNDVKGTDIQKIENNMPAWRDVQEETFEKQFYYKTEDNVWFSMSVVRNASSMTGYDILAEGLESREERLAYADASNASFCYGETYDNDNAVYYAGTEKNGLWLFMAMLCPKDYESEYKKYLETWRSSVKETGAAYSWQKQWAEYKEGKYVFVQNLNSDDSNLVIQHCLDIQSASEEEIIFSLTRMEQRNGEKTITTSGYIRGYIINDSVMFTVEWPEESEQGILRRGIDGEHLLLEYGIDKVYLFYLDSY